MRRRTFYVTWHQDHPDTDYAHPLAFTVILAATIDDARAAMTDLVGPDGWELQTDPPGPKELYPLGCQSVLSVVGETAALFVRDASGRFAETELVPA